MPTYEYQCQSCGHEFELFQSMTAGTKRKCPECSQMKLQRLIGSGAGIIFRGSGFYETDYRSESYKKAAQAEKKAASGTTDAKKPAASDGTKSTADSKTAGTPKKDGGNKGASEA